MRWVRFSSTDVTESWGVVEGDTVREVSGSPFEGYRSTGRVHQLDSITIDVPLVPRTFYAAGLNYVRHIREYAGQLGGLSVPANADVGYRATNALVAHGQPVIIPADATEVQYEGELVVVIGKKARNLSEDEALGCVLGYTIGNDVSERNWQRSDRTLWRAKNTDSFKPMGPWIETEFDLDAAQTVVRVNGEERTRFRTSEMLFSVQTFISRMSRYITLYPTDVIWMGTDGVSPNLVSGDVVEIDISGIGCLRNPFVTATDGTVGGS